MSSPVASAVASALASTTAGTVHVGFSGGADSSALLLAARTLADGAPWRLRALHANHALHPDADQWERHCVAVCASLGVALRTTRLTVSREGNLEQAARRARYAFFAEELAEGDLLLLGHHEQDQTETMLLRLLQGRGLIPMRSHGALGAGRFVRPLLRLSRSALVEYLQQHGQGWIDDPSNTDLGFDRNYLRQTIVPPAASRWPRLGGTLAAVADRQRDVGSALSHALATLGDDFERSLIPPQLGPGAAWLRAYLQHRGVFDVSNRALSGFVRALAKGRGERLRGQSDGRAWQLGCYRTRVYFEFETPAVRAPDQRLTLGARLDLEHGVLRLDAAPDARVFADELAFDYPGPLRVAFRAGGEALQTPAGAVALQEVFSRGAVPPWRRDRYPLLYAGPELVCVPNLASRGDPGSCPCTAVWMPGGVTANKSAKVDGLN